MSVVYEQLSVSMTNYRLLKKNTVCFTLF